MDGKLLEVFSITPFGIYCKRCSGATSLTHHSLTERGLHEHLKTHSLTASRASRDEFVTFATLRQTELRNQGDYGNYIIRETTAKCCLLCKVAFSTAWNARRHNVSCSRGIIADARCFYTLCYRLIMSETLVPGNYHIHSFRPYDASLAWINRHVRDDEPADGYLPMLHAFLCQHDDADGAIRQRLEWANNGSTADEMDLDQVLSAGITWLKERSSYDIMMIRPDIRSKMMIFDPRQVDEVVVNTGFTARYTTNGTSTELSKLLRFAWRHTGHQLWRSEHNAFPFEADPFLIPRMLIKLALQTANQNVFEIPVVMEYCITRLFRVQDDDLVIVDSNYSSSMLGATLYLLRAGACSQMYAVSLNHLSYSMKLANDICTADVVQMICRAIRHLRNMASNKHQADRRRVSPNGDITIGQSVFSGTVWRQLIPILNARGDNLVRKIFGTQGDINHWLDRNNQIRLLENGEQIKMTMVLSSGRVLNSEDLNVLTDTWLNIGELRALCTLALFGLGGGCCRGNELFRLPYTHSSLSNNCLYYSVRKIKQISCLRGTSGKIIEHKLPVMLSRMVLLMRHACQLCGCNTKTLVPSELPHAPATMESYSQQIFTLHSPPTLHTLRQLFASISNYVFNSSNHPGGKISTSPKVAKLFGHSPITHDQSYNTLINDGGESLFNFWHMALGDNSTSTMKRDYNPMLTSTQLQQGLVGIFGQGGRFRTTSQKCLLEALISGKNVMGNIPCGEGKSLAFVLPTVVEVLEGYPRSRVLVVCPYKFLASSHMANTVKVLDGKHDITCETLSRNDCLNTKKLDELFSQESADIYFLSLEAIHFLLYNKLNEMLELVTSGGIRRIVLDECHTIYNEQFRPHYEVLSRMSLLGIPIILLTGTLPVAWEECLCTKLQMRSDADIFPRVNYVHGEDVMGNYPESFHFSIHNYDSHMGCMAQVKKKVEKILLKDPRSQIHVMCQTKSMVDYLSDNLTSLQHVSREHPLYDMMQGSNPTFRVVSLSSSSSESRQQTVATDWSNGRINCLVSTTCALVGTENKACKHLIIAGILYNVMTFVQACKRLRPEQCENGSIRVLYSRKGHTRMLIPLKCQSNELSTIKEGDKQMLKLLQEEKLIGSTDEDTDRYMTVGSRLGLISFLECKDKCRLRDISERFGGQRVACGLCDNCKRGVEAQAMMKQQQRQGEKRVAQEIGMRGNVYKLLSILRRLCIFCRSSSCDGNDCIGKKDGHYCFFCDDDSHSRSMCTLEISLKRELHNQVCFGCLDMSDFAPRNERCYGKNMKNCNLQRRLKRLIVHDYKQVKLSLKDLETFGQYLQRKTNQGRWVEYYDYLGRKYKQLIGCMDYFQPTSRGTSLATIFSSTRGLKRNRLEAEKNGGSLRSYFSKTTKSTATKATMDGRKRKATKGRKLEGEGEMGSKGGTVEGRKMLLEGNVKAVTPGTKTRVQQSDTKASPKAATKATAKATATAPTGRTEIENTTIEEMKAMAITGMASSNKEKAKAVEVERRKDDSVGGREGDMIEEGKSVSSRTGSRKIESMIGSGTSTSQGDTTEEHSNMNDFIIGTDSFRRLSPALLSDVTSELNGISPLLTEEVEFNYSEMIDDLMDDRLERDFGGFGDYL